MDLLTVAVHELGHVLGLEDLDPHEAGDDVMSGVLSIGATLADRSRALSQVHRIDRAKGIPQERAAGIVNSGSRAHHRVTTQPGGVESAISLIAGIDQQSVGSSKPVAGVACRLPDGVWDDDWLAVEDELLDQLAVERAGWSRMRRR
jgi:hypothetical protein